MAHLEEKQFDRATIFVRADMETALREVLGDDAVVDLFSNLSEGWLRVTSNRWEHTTEAAAQAKIDSVPVPITYESSLRRYTNDPTWNAVIEWIATEHDKTPEVVISELRAILISTAED